MTFLTPIRLTLKKDISASILAGHPWIYDHALNKEGPSQTATVADVYSTKNQFLAKGIWDPQSPLRVRIYTLQKDVVLDGDFLQKRLEQALFVRMPLLEVTNAFRLCHGEADFLPGLVIDIYNGYAVVQFDSLAVRNHFSSLLPKVVKQILANVGLPCLGILERSRFLQPLVLFGKVPQDSIVIHEHGADYEVNLWRGQKTGFFLDQRKNRLHIRNYSKGKHVWNGFCYTGGFSVQAAKGGALHVTSIDIADAAIQTAKRNFVINQLNGPHTFLTQDVFDTLNLCIAKKQTFDLVIVDPPSFAHSQKTLSKAIMAYKNLFTLALQITAPNGLIAISSCSSHLTEDTFLQIFATSAALSRKEAQIVFQGSHDIDHPVLPSFPEGNYLKFLLAKV